MTFAACKCDAEQPTVHDNTLIESHLITISEDWSLDPEQWKSEVTAQGVSRYLITKITTSSMKEQELNASDNDLINWMNKGK